MNIIKSVRGVTLVELMIVVAIIGIIAAIGYPAYQNYTRETKREAAKAELTKTASLLEQYYLNTKTYNVALATLGANTTIDGYTLSNVGTVNTYTLTATPSGTQASDTCGTLTLTQGGNNTPANCW